MGLLIPHWDTHQLPKPHGMSKTEGLDLDNLTVMDLSWRTIMRITAEFLVTSLENLYSGTFSRGDLGVSTKARTTQTLPPREG